MGRKRELHSKKDIKSNYQKNSPFFGKRKKGNKQIKLTSWVNEFLKDEAQEIDMKC